MYARGSTRRYFPEPTKNILVVNQINVDSAEEFLCGMGLQVVTGSPYLGGFIGYGVAEKRWMAGKVKRWAESVRTLTRVSCKHP